MRNLPLLTVNQSRETRQNSYRSLDLQRNKISNNKTVSNNTVTDFLKHYIRENWCPVYI